jgi:hypothetical protein
MSETFIAALYQNYVSIFSHHYVNKMLTLCVSRTDTFRNRLAFSRVFYRLAFLRATAGNVHDLYEP